MIRFEFLKFIMNLTANCRKKEARENRGLLTESDRKLLAKLINQDIDNLDYTGSNG